MAFKVLNEREIDKLTYEQRKVYYKELEKYKKRADFVEYMEKAEAVKLEHYQINIQPIHAECKISDVELKVREYSESMLKDICVECDYDIEKSLIQTPDVVLPQVMTAIDVNSLEINVETDSSIDIDCKEVKIKSITWEVKAVGIDSVPIVNEGCVKPKKVNISVENKYDLQNYAIEKNDIKEIKIYEKSHKLDIPIIDSPQIKEYSVKKYKYNEKELDIVFSQPEFDIQMIVLPDISLELKSVLPEDINLVCGKIEVLPNNKQRISNALLQKFENALLPRETELSVSIENPISISEIVRYVSFSHQKEVNMRNNANVKVPAVNTIEVPKPSEKLVSLIG